MNGLIFGERSRVHNTPIVPGIDHDVYEGIRLINQYEEFGPHHNRNDTYCEQDCPDKRVN